MAIKKKYARVNQGSFMNKKLYKAIMVISWLRNKFLKRRSVRDKKAFKKPRNMWVLL